MSGPGLGEPGILDPSRLTEAQSNSLRPILNFCFTICEAPPPEGFLKISPCPRPCGHLSLKGPPLDPSPDSSRRKSESPPKRVHSSALSPMVLPDSRLPCRLQARRG